MASPYRHNSQTVLMSDELQAYVLQWSPYMEEAERLYKESGGVKTKGSVFLPFPDNESIKKSFSASHKDTKLSVGARALCKHYERKREKGNPHPFWSKPIGSEETKSSIALKQLEEIIETCTWKNLYMLHGDTMIYEIRNSMNYGMRWEVTSAGCLVFRGFLEPTSFLEMA